MILVVAIILSAIIGFGVGLGFACALAALHQLDGR